MWLNFCAVEEHLSVLMTVAAQAAGTGPCTSTCEDETTVKPISESPESLVNFHMRT